jgi:hypothetical protein
MRYDHAPGGVRGITLKKESLKVWALSLHACSRLEADLDEVIKNSIESEYRKHKEEGKTRIANDTKDRQCLRAELVDFVIDGSALLWVVPWPPDDTLVDYTDNMKQILAKKLILGDVHLVFDRNYEYSTKGETRSARVNGAS